MGDVIAVLSVSPESPEVDLVALKGAIEAAMPANAELQGIAEKPVAFGLKNLDVTVVLADVEGGPDAVEEALSGLDGVQSVKVTDVGRF